MYKYSLLLNLGRFVNLATIFYLKALIFFSLARKEGSFFVGAKFVLAHIEFAVSIKHRKFADMNITRRNFLTLAGLATLANIASFNTLFARKNFAGVNEIKNARGNVANAQTKIFNASAMFVESENDVKNLLLNMSQNYVFKSVLSVPTAAQYGAFFDVSKARNANENTYKLTLGNTDKLLPCAILPVCDIDFAVSQLEKSKKIWGFFGAVIPTQLNGRYLDAKSLAKIFKKADELKMPIFVAPKNTSANPVARDAEIGYFASQIGALNALKEYKNLKIVLPFMGGSLPFTLARNSVKFDDENSVEYASYFENFYFICGEVYDENLYDVIKRTIPVSKLLFGASTDVAKALENLRQIGHFEKILKGGLL